MDCSYYRFSKITFLFEISSKYNIFRILENMAKKTHEIIRFIESSNIIVFYNNRALVRRSRYLRKFHILDL